MSSPSDRLDPVIVHHIVNSLGWKELRRMQEESIAPLLDGMDALLLAPTAGGKTEAAMFPLLTRMAAEKWQDTSVLYLCPLRALLNNLEPRIDTYAGWIGRRAATWHGDVTASARRSILSNRPDVLLTTPESLEAMLVSVNVDHIAFFSGLRAVVVDEVHAFAADDRGWHALAVLERLSRVVGRPLQRIGLSATVGNPDELVRWLQGSGASARPSIVVAPQARIGATDASPPGDIELDYVGSLSNAATVIAGLHAGQKRLVFCEARATVEELGAALRSKGVTTFLSHASLSTDERRRAEQAFAEARDCVIVSTSTLELGIDIGDLDRVIQIESPSTVASFLQRLGRTGRRPGSSRNCLLLTTTSGSLVEAAALLHLWHRGWVEPAVPPPEPRHIVAQQVLALTLQRHRLGDSSWRQEWNELAPFDASAAPIVGYLAGNGFLDSDSGMYFIGPAAELRFGHRHFMDMTAVFTSAPEFAVFAGRHEVGRIDPSLLTEEVRGERRLLLGGRSWRVTYTDWRRRRCFVEPADGGGRARWTTMGFAGIGFELARSVREVLLGADPPVRITRRAAEQLAHARKEAVSFVHPGGNVIVRDQRREDVRWWTWAGFKANATLMATLSEVVDPAQRFDDFQIRLRTDLTRRMWLDAVRDAPSLLCLPDVNEKALVGLKFSDALPKKLAMSTLAARMADLDGATVMLSEPARFIN